MVKTREFDIQNYLTDPESIIYFLNAALEANDAHFFTQALGEVAKSEGMTKLAQRSGIPRESLYQILSGKGNPRLDTLMRVLDNLGFSLSLRPLEESEEETSKDHKNKEGIVYKEPTYA